MKKIISVIAVLLLGMGIVSAQTAPTFNYQSVVVDDNGNLVVDATVNVNVMISYNGGSYSEQHTVTTSPNGLANIPIGGASATAGFNDIDWRTATITVTYSTPGHSISASETTPVEAVPYAIQADNVKMNTPTIVDYLNNQNTDMQDAYEILAALEANPNGLQDSVVRAAVDYVIANRSIAKQIMLYYIQNATAQDVQVLNNALEGNEEAMRVLKKLIVDFIVHHKPLVKEVLMYYASVMTTEDANTILDSIPANVKTAMVNYGMSYVQQHKMTVLYPILMDYIANLTTEEFASMIQSFESNTNGAFDLVLQQFNAWMDDYFAQIASDDHVTSIIDEELANRNWVEDTCSTTGTIDVCQLATDVAQLEAAGQNTVVDCPTLSSVTVEPINNNGDEYEVKLIASMNNVNLQNAQKYGFRVTYNYSNQVVEFTNLNYDITTNSNPNQNEVGFETIVIMGMNEVSGGKVVPFVQLSNPCPATSNTTEFTGDESPYSF